ncbi:unnamed protein product [Effrenium voratum]|nr:unnamed protein product [Effrenium voratum]
MIGARCYRRPTLSSARVRQCPMDAILQNCGGAAFTFSWKQVASAFFEALVRLGQVCGVLAALPDRLEDVDPLAHELSGRGILYRIDDAWAVVSKGCHDIMELMTRKADQIIAAGVAREIGDFDARIHRECLERIAAHQGFKEGLELTVPRHSARVRMWPNDSEKEKVPARGASPFRAHSALSTTCPENLSLFGWLTPPAGNTPSPWPSLQRPSERRSLSHGPPHDAM